MLSAGKIIKGMAIATKEMYTDLTPYGKVSAAITVSGTIISVVYGVKYFNKKRLEHLNKIHRKFTFNGFKAEVVDSKDEAEDVKLDEDECEVVNTPEEETLKAKILRKTIQGIELITAFLEVVDYIVSFVLAVGAIIGFTFKITRAGVLYARNN